jgi:hypothetical protein
MGSPNTEWIRYYGANATKAKLQYTAGSCIMTEVEM